MVEPGQGEGGRWMRDFQARFGDLVIDVPAWEVTLDGRVIELTRTEFEILVALASRPRQVITDDELVRTVWGDGWFGDDNNLAVHVSKLRSKLGESGLKPRFIRTVRGVGYRFDPGPEHGSRPTAHRRHCDTLRPSPGAVEVRMDGQLHVVSVQPEGAQVLGFDPLALLGRYVPVVAEHHWDHQASALKGIQMLISSGVREWTARHGVRRGDGTLTHAEIATCFEVDDDGRLESLCFVIVDPGSSLDGSGGGASVNSGHRAATRLA